MPGAEINLPGAVVEEGMATVKGEYQIGIPINAILKEVAANPGLAPVKIALPGTNFSLQLHITLVENEAPANPFPSAESGAPTPPPQPGDQPA
jgi:hypothetical protein